MRWEQIMRFFVIITMTTCHLPHHLISFDPADHKLKTMKPKNLVYNQLEGNHVSGIPTKKQFKCSYLDNIPRIITIDKINGEDISSSLDDSQNFYTSFD